MRLLDAMWIGRRRPITSSPRLPMWNMLDDGLTSLSPASRSVGDTSIALAALGSVLEGDDSGAAGSSARDAMSVVSLGDEGLARSWCHGSGGTARGGGGGEASGSTGESMGGAVPIDDGDDASSASVSVALVSSVSGTTILGGGTGSAPACSAWTAASPSASRRASCDSLSGTSGAASASGTRVRSDASTDASAARETELRRFLRSSERRSALRDGTRVLLSLASLDRGPAADSLCTGNVLAASASFFPASRMCRSLPRLLMALLCFDDVDATLGGRVAPRAGALPSAGMDAPCSAGARSAKGRWSFARKLGIRQRATRPGPLVASWVSAGCARHARHGRGHASRAAVVHRGGRPQRPCHGRVPEGVAHARGDEPRARLAGIEAADGRARCRRCIRRARAGRGAARRCAGAPRAGAGPARACAPTAWADPGR